MQTLTKGFKKPETDDSGAEWFVGMNTNIQKMNDHAHNGVESALLSIAAVACTTQNILAAAWVATAGGTYRQLVTMPAGLTGATPALTYDTVSIQFRLSTGEIIYPSVEKASSTTFYVYTNDNSLAYVAVYTT